MDGRQREGQGPTRDAGRTARRWLVILGYLLLHLLLFALANRVTPPETVLVWFPPAGLTFAFLIVFGLRMLPVVILARLLADYLIFYAFHPPMHVIFVYLFVALGYVVGVTAIRASGLRGALRGMGDVRRFILAALGIPILIACGAVGVLTRAGVVPVDQFDLALLQWWVGDAVGIVTFAPCLLIIAEAARAWVAGTPPHADEPGTPSAPRFAALLWVLGVAVILWLTFASPLAKLLPIFYLIALPLLGLAIRAGMRQVAEGIALTSIGTMVADALTGMREANIAQLLIFLITLGLSALLLGAVVAERRHAEAVGTRERANLQAVSRALRLLSDVNQAIIHAEDEQALLQQVCELLQRQGGYQFVWIGVPQDDPAHTVRPVASAGLVAFPAIEHVYWADVPEGRGPTGIAVRTRQPVYIRELDTDPRFTPWREAAVSVGLRSALSLPLIAGETLFGVLALLSATPADFEVPGEMELLREMANDLAYGIGALRTQIERTRALEDLAAERAFFATTFDILPFPLVVTDTAGVVTRVNQALQRLEPELVPGICWQPLFCAPDSTVPLPVDERPLVRALRGETTRAREAVLLHPGDERIPVLVHAAPVYRDGRRIAAVVSFQDISALKEADRAKDQFLAVLTHELLTPLTSILGWAQIAVSDPDLSQEALTVIVRNAHRQHRLLDDLLDISRSIHGKLSLAPAAVDLRTLAQESVDESRPAAGARHLTLQLELPATPLPVYADPGRLRQVIGNLLNNALKFTDPGGTVTVRGRRTDDTVELQVQDTGRGIPPEVLPTLFAPFRQVARTERTGGLGLGLALVRIIIEHSGGTVRADSPGLDRGSTFTVTLPLLQQ